MSDATINGQPANLDDAIIRAAEILRAARRPLFQIGPFTTIEAQREAVRITGQLAGVIDAPTATPLFPNIGSVTCSLGEVKNRADLILLWHCQPEGDHAQLLQEILVAHGRFRKRRSGRTMVAVGNSPPAAPLQVDSHIQCDPKAAFSALWLLRAIVRDQPASDLQVGGTPVTAWKQLIVHVKTHQFVVLVLDELVGPRAIEAAHGLATELQSQLRCYVVVLRRGPNPLGLETVLASHPEIGAHSTIRGNDFDAVVRVGHQHSGNAASPGFRRIPQIALSAHNADTNQSSTVWIDPVACGAADHGQVIRWDGLCLPWSAVSPASVPNDFAVLNRLAKQLRPA
jgi:formylmethanofuran dehydrogenase subunit B